MLIHGKEYMEVKDRILELRTNEKYKGYRLCSDIITRTDKDVTIKAFIYDAEDRLVATGYANEVEGSSNINRTSHIENCETSAWGRALGNLGIGVLESVASADEVVTAISRQNSFSSKPKQLSEKQIACLQKNNKWVEGMSFDEGKAALEAIFAK
jgi:hypothetical protein